MMRFYYLFLLSIANLAVCSQNIQLPQPPGGIFLYEYIYIDRVEIANIHWLEYQFYVKQDSSQAYYESTFIDSSVWIGMGKSGKILTRGYYSIELNRYFPVVGITKKQALDYCEWRSAAVNLFFENKKNDQPNWYRRYEIKVLYRLPTEKEWEFAASSPLDVRRYPYGYKKYYGRPPKLFISNIEELLEVLDTAITKKQLKKDIQNYYKSRGSIQFKCKKEMPYFYVAEDVLPDSVERGMANSKGLINMIGNVAEMISEDGIAKGGSWLHPLYECKIESRQNYIKPTSWLGFRCVAEVFLIPIK